MKAEKRDTCGTDAYLVLCLGACRQVARVPVENGKTQTKRKDYRTRCKQRQAKQRRRGKPERVEV